MIKNWSIKFLLLFWATITVVVVLVMALMANYANSLTSSTQHVFSDKLLPLHNSSRELSTTASSLISRQKQFLATDSIRAIEQFTQRSLWEQAFHQNWLRLSAIFSHDADNAILINSLFSYYQDFLSLDSELYQLKKDGLLLKTELKQYRDDVDLQAKAIRQQLDEIEQRLHRENLLSVISQTFAIRADLYKLEALITETFLTSNSEQLEALLEHRQQPLKTNIQSDLSVLERRLAGLPALENQVAAMNNDMQTFYALVFDEARLYKLHQQRLLNHALLEQGEESAMAVMSVLNDKIVLLNDTVDQQTYQAVAKNVQLADRTRWQIVILGGLITVGMILFALFLFSRISKPLHKIRESMHDLSAGRFETHIEQHQSHNEVLRLAKDFTFFAGNTEQLITELAQAKESLENREQHILAILNGVPEAILTLDMNGKIEQTNPAAERIFHATENALVGENIFRFFAHSETVTSFNDIIEQAAEGKEFDGQRYDGSDVSMVLSLSQIRAAKGEVWVCVITDISTRKRTELQLQQATTELNAILDNAMVGIAFLRDRQFVRVNEKFEELFGYTRDDIEGQSVQCLYLNADAYVQFGEEAYYQLTSGDNYEAQLEMVRKDGQVFWCGISGKAIDAGSPKAGTIWLFEDITIQRQNEEHLTRLASIDGLTGLPNRAVFTDRVEHAIHKSMRNSGRLAVFFLDLDHFKHINDSLGHKAGDILLTEVAGRIKACVREGDTVARLGGDEFTLLLEDVRSAEYVGKVAEKVIKSITQLYQIENTEVNISPSIGISLYPADGRDVDMLVRNADAAMYHAKKVGRNNFQFYSAEMNAEAAKRLAMETALRRAVEQQDLYLHYQPQVNLQTGKLVGAEVLLRWQSEQWGNVSPAEFVPMLEDTGMITQVGEWILRQACATYLEWSERLPDKFMMAVNLSGRQFKGGTLAGFIRRLLDETGMPAAHLELEITESMLMDDTELATITLAELSAMNISLAIDDFGTGYSSLSYLKQFPLNVLKIDSSFVRDVTSDRDDAAIVDAIMAMSNSLGLKVVAEGVETAEQRQYLLRHDCRLAQGFLFSKAVDKDKFSTLIDQATLI